MYQTIIIGGGAAGLFLAANLTGKDNLLLEGTKKLGQKILITGGGMCNITNMDETDEFITRFGGKKKINFLKPALLNLSTEKTREWLKSNGLNITVREDGKVFPESLKAQSLIVTLQKKAKQNGIEFKYNSKVTTIKSMDNGFEVITEKDNFLCKNLVFATGGKSFPTTGSDGSAYQIIKSLGHKIVEPTQALAGLKISDYFFTPLSGSSIRAANIEIFRNGESKRYLNKIGDLLFTHRGLSGPVILNNSREIRGGDKILTSLISCSNKEEKRAELQLTLNNSGKKIVKSVLKEIGLTVSMINILTNYIKIKPDQTVLTLNKKEKNRLINNLLNFSFTVSSKVGFNAAMVTAGGVDISEINRKTMESKIVKNLYFAGEVIDIDGDTGGYNIQAAFSTSKLISEVLL